MAWFPRPARWGMALALAAAAGRGAGAPATNPAADPLGPPPPATAPATRPAWEAAAAADAARLVAELAAGDWRRRERAKPELVRLGDAARPALEELVRTATTIDARDAAADTLNQIAANRVTGPTYVSLHFKDAPPREVFAELARQAGAALDPWPDNLWTTGRWQPVTIDIDRQPFWAAVTELTAATKVELRDMNRGLKLVRGGGAGGRPLVAGAFLIVANQISRNQTIQLAPNAVRADETFALHLTAYAEPKLRVFQAPGPVKLEEAVDDRGNSLLPPPGGSRGQGYFGGSGSVWSLTAALQYPKQPGKKITRLRGTATFAVQTRGQSVEIPDLLRARGAVRKVGGVRMTLDDAGKVGTQYRFNLTVARETASPEAWAQIQGSIQSRLSVQDAAGRPLQSRGGGNGSRPDTMTINLVYVAVDPDGHATGEPAKLVWDYPLEIRELPVPFEFTDLPLPR